MGRRGDTERLANLAFKMAAPSMELVFASPFNDFSQLHFVDRSHERTGRTFNLGVLVRASLSSSE